MNQRRVSLRWRLLTVAGIFLFFQVSLIARNGCEIERSPGRAANVTSSEGNKQIKDSSQMNSAPRLETKSLEEEKAHQVQLQRLQYVEKTADAEIDRSGALIYGVHREKKGFMTVGIPSIQRLNVTYLEDTIASLSERASEEERQEIVVVAFLADLDDDYRLKVANKLKSKFLRELNEGFLHIIQAPKSFYPNMEFLERTFNDPEKRVRWRSKQNYDYAYLMKYSQNISSYYMQIEDDVIAADHYSAQVKNALQRYIKKHWTCIEFSDLGFIGKFFKSDDIGRLAKFLIIFFDQEPVDLLFPYFFRIMTQPKPIISRPSLFQHMGLRSSFNNNKNKLKDIHFMKITKTIKGDNPEAIVRTNIETFEDYKVERAYNVSDTSGFFWGKSSKVGDFIQIEFKVAHHIKQLVILTGNAQHGDILSSAAIEVSSGQDECSNFVKVGEMGNGTADIQIAKSVVPSEVKCVQIRVTQDHKNWLVLNEVAVVTGT